MDRPEVTAADHIGSLRRWLFWTLVLGLMGTETELLLLEHYEDAWQVVPLLLIAFAVTLLAWHRRRHDRRSLSALRMLMVLFLLSGAVGLALHFRGAAEFQRELDPAAETWHLVGTVMRVKAPPVLAPGMMLQLGLLGLAYAASHSTH